MMGTYEAGDIRKAISCGTSQNVNYVKKYTDLDDVNGYGANNWIVLRYADVALMLAEVKMHLGESDAASYLNMVRERAGLDDYSGSNLRDAFSTREEWNSLTRDNIGMIYYVYIPVRSY
jgi:hypothetical protein